jgi:ABC-type antimicrobial peptide transport system permease subunit
VSVPRPVRLSPLDLLGLGLLGIRTRKMRAALSALGIAIGIATMVVVTGIPASSQKALLQQLSSLGTDMLRAGVAAASDDTGNPAVEQVRSVLPATIDPNQPSQVQVSRPSDALAAKRATESTFSALFLGLAGVALLVGGVGVANTMVISVLERRSEIGLRRALGAHRGQIRTQFLTESVALSTLGGLAGTVLGLAATAGYAYWQHWPVVVPLTAIGVGIGERQ